MNGTGETILLVEPATATNRYGDTIDDWDSATLHEIAGVLVAPQLRGEITPLGREGVPGNVTIYYPAGCDIAASDRVQVRGDLFEVDGQPITWASGHGARRSGRVADLKRIEG